MIVFDLETNGLLNDVSTIHCAVLHDTEADTTLVYNDQGTKEPIVRAITLLEEADCIVGHNIIGYDIPVIQKLYPFFQPKGMVIDTLLLSRLYHADMLRVDNNRKWFGMPLQLYGRHSLEAFGYRLGTYKGQFGKTTDWKEWSQEMEDYCIQDIEVTKRLCTHFSKKFLAGS